MAKEKHVSATPATDWLKAHKVNFKLHTYDFVPHGGTTQGAKELGIDNHVMIKTLIMEDENAEPLVILMHGDCEVSTKNLARQVGRKHIAPCTPEQAQRTRKRMPIYVQRTVSELPVIYINGGRRGVVAEMAGSVLVDVLGATPVDVANPKDE